MPETENGVSRDPSVRNRYFENGKLLQDTAKATGIPTEQLVQQYRFAPLIHERFVQMYPKLPCQGRQGETLFHPSQSPASAGLRLFSNGDYRLIYSCLRCYGVQRKFSQSS